MNHLTLDYLWIVYILSIFNHTPSYKDIFSKRRIKLIGHTLIFAMKNRSLYLFYFYLLLVSVAFLLVITKALLQRRRANSLLKC